MKKLIRRWLGIDKLAEEVQAQNMLIKVLYIGKQKSPKIRKALRYDEIQRAQSRRRHGKQTNQYHKGATTEESSPT